MKNCILAEEDGVNYREIADTMSFMGFPMNHSSARNYVIRVMKKIVDALVDELDIDVDDSRAITIAKSPLFQECIADVFHELEDQRRRERNT